MRAFFRSTWDKFRTGGRCQAVALGTDGCRLLGWYHWNAHCVRPKDHGDPNGLGRGTHVLRGGGVWAVK